MARARSQKQRVSVPYGSSLAQAIEMFPSLAHLADEWDAGRNDKGIDAVTASSNYEAWWRCEREHEWRKRVSDRVQGGSCPYCIGRRVLAGFNDLATSHPHLTTEWHYERNGDLKPSQVTSGMTVKPWWRAACGHEWQAYINTRVRGSGCPFCAGLIPDPGVNDLATLHPHLVAEWHSALNESLAPSQFLPGSGRTVWWQCRLGHEWRAMIGSRAKGTGCPVCAGLTIKTGFSDLATRYPEIAAEWHPTNNGDVRADQVAPGSTKHAWWLGSCGHEWRAIINSRKRTGCPRCARSQTSRTEQMFRERFARGGLLRDVNPDHTRRLRVPGLPHYASLQVDILGYLTSGKPVVVMYDGSYWHRSARSYERDAIATRALLNSGYTVVRIREQSSEHKLRRLDVEHPRLLQIEHAYLRNASTHDSEVEATAQKVEDWLARSTSQSPA